MAAQPFPDEAFITQRAILTARGRQFTLNGYLSLSARGGRRLIITENFGTVLADVLVKPDGAIHVMRSSAAIPKKWIEHHITNDLQCIFGGMPKKKCREKMLSPKHFVVERFWYTLDLQIVDIKAGPQPAAMFDPNGGASR